MKVEYFYDGQMRRVLKHLIRLFGEFQVSNGYDENGELKLKSVPCRYADIARMTAYILQGNSENVMQTLPNITINIQSLKMDRANMTAPTQSSTVVGINKSPEENVYTNELDEIYHVQKYNPIPWELTFNVNICTTTTTAKLELFEQITSLFNPSVQLQLNENPTDWTSVSNVELIDCTFSNRAFPQGLETDLDIMQLSFKTTVWLSLPAKVQKAKLIQQIVTNIGTIKDEMDIELKSFSEISTEVFTPKNMCIKTKLISKDAISEKYELTLVNKNMSEVNSNGSIYSWDLYMTYLKPNYKESQCGINLLDEIEDPYSISTNIIEYSSEPNKIIVEIDNSKYKVTYTVKKFITSEYDYSTTSPSDNYINASSGNLNVLGTIVKPNELFNINNGVVSKIEASNIHDYVYCSEDSYFYKFDDLDAWHKAIHPSYRQGYWRLTFK